MRCNLESVEEWVLAMNYVTCSSINSWYVLSSYLLANWQLLNLSFPEDQANKTVNLVFVNPRKWLIMTFPARYFLILVEARSHQWVQENCRRPHLRGLSPLPFAGHYLKGEKTNRYRKSVVHRKSVILVSFRKESLLSSRNYEREYFILHEKCILYKTQFLI